MSSPDEEKVTYFGLTDSRNKKVQFGIKRKDRSKHTYVIGKTGMGKSTMLENMAIQDIQNGEGLAFIDPHGQTAELLLDYVPESRMKDVLYFAPFDMEYPISFNVMEDVGADRRHLVANGLMSVFEKIWVDAWSARMAYILNNTLLALLEYPGSTLLGVNRMLADKEYRKKVVENVTDPSVKSFWIDEFGKYTEKFAAEATPAIQNKVGQFTSNPLVRNIIGQPRSTFDIRKMMDEKKIIIINLSKGRVGEGNANLIGSMLITKIYLAAMSRADLTKSEMSKLPNFYLYVDEFQSFANKSFADILSEARKYKLNLTIAHQYIEQMEEEVRDAVFGNVGTMISFRVGALDSEVLEKEFAPRFTAEDLVNLGIYQIYLKLMIDGVSSPPFSAVTMPPIDAQPHSFKDEIVASSRSQFAQPRKVVEDDIKLWHLPIVKTVAPVASSPSAIKSTPIIKSSIASVAPVSSSASSVSSTSSPKPFSPPISNAKVTNVTADIQTTRQSTFPRISTVPTPTPSSAKPAINNHLPKAYDNTISNRESPKAISLNTLKSSNESSMTASGIQQKKQQAGANVSALRAALSNIMKQSTEPAPHQVRGPAHKHESGEKKQTPQSEQSENSQKNSEKNTDKIRRTPSQSVQGNAETSKEKLAEVDEKILKKVLEIKGLS